MTLNKISNKIIFGAITVATLLTGFVNFNASAQTTANRGIIVSPAIMELEADRGNSYEFTVKIENDTPDTNYTMRSLVNSFEAGSEEGIPVIKELPDGSELKNWIKFDQEEFTLASRESFDSVFKVNVPDEAKPGSYFLAVTYATGDKEKVVTNSKVVVEQRVAALLFVTVKGKVERQVEFKTFATNKQVYDPFFDGLKLDYKIGTEGNVYLKPAGNIFVGNDINNPEATLALNPNENFILPNSSRTFEFVNQAKLNIPFLTQKVTGEREVEISRPWFGTQKITANVLFADSEGKLERKEIETQVLFIPWKSGLLLLVTVGAAVGAYFVAKPKFSKEK